MEKVGGIYCITADHGNCDDMAQRNKKTGEPIKGPGGEVEPLTSHTLNPVSAPFAQSKRGEGRGGGGCGKCSHHSSW